MCIMRVLSSARSMQVCLVVSAGAGVVQCAQAQLSIGRRTCCLAACVLQLCDGASPEERERWFLRPAQEFHYLNQSTCYDIPGDSNAEEYKVSKACISFRSWC